MVGVSAYMIINELHILELNRLRSVNSYKELDII